MKHILGLAMLAIAGVAVAQTLPNGSGYITYMNNSGSYSYDIFLTNTGSTTIGTFWYAWNPGQDYLPTLPTDVMAPTGWTEQITHGGSGDGYAIEFTANAPADYLNPTQTLSGFKFTSTDTPAILDGPSGFYSGANVGDSFLYHAGPFSDAGTQITVLTVPEPSSAWILVPVAGLLFLKMRR